MRKLIVPLVLCIISVTGVAQVQWNDMPLSPGTFSDATTPYQQSDYEVLVPAGVGLEFKLSMKDGDFMVYSWTSDVTDPALLDVEFHGHTEPVDDQGDLMFYKVHNEGRESGTLKAPFDGIHGWYLNNRSDRDVVVKLTASGFFEDVE